ncbi:MAG: response regulator transcription factor [Clostridiaceae bacterium]|nr:response regulator transcription factor [Clostridiaceae bacterium]
MEQWDVLIVEDDESLLLVTRDFLEDNGLKVKICSSGSSALGLIKKNDFKLVVLDINLPDIIGFEVCNIIRKTSKVPIIFLSARISDKDKVTGLEIGGDDYISKPYSLNELLYRIKAQIRRKYDYDAKVNENFDLFSFGQITVNFSSRKILINGIEKDFPAKEFELLTYLIKNKNKSISKETLYNEIWGFNSLGEINTLSVHIRRLREKVEKNPSRPEFIKTIWAFGFRFEV